MDFILMSRSFVQHPSSPYPVLEKGIHKYSLEELKVSFAYNEVRHSQFNGLLKALKNLKDSGCERVYIDGSYVTKKNHPGDFDVCVDYSSVDLQKLDPVFFDFSDKRKSQKEKYLGEFFPHDFLADGINLFLDFFQIDKYSNKPKGIIEIDLLNDEVLK